MLPRMLKGLIFSFGALAAVLAMIFVDQDLSRFFFAKEHEALRLAAREVTDIALGEYWFGLAIFAYAFGRFWPAEGARFTVRRETLLNLRRWGAHLFLGLLGSGLLLQLGKMAVGRQRPHLSEPLFDPFVFHPLNFDWHYQSMPSGHTQVMFSVAASAALLWPRSGWLFLPMAAAISFTRVMTLQHWTSDVIAGALVGYFGTLWVRSLVAKKIPVPAFYGRNKRET